MVLHRNRFRLWKFPDKKIHFVQMYMISKILIIICFPCNPKFGMAEIALGKNLL
jgi:hypothetical protein